IHAGSERRKRSNCVLPLDRSRPPPRSLSNRAQRNARTIPRTSAANNIRWMSQRRRPKTPASAAACCCGVSATATPELMSSEVLTCSSRLGVLLASDALKPFKVSQYRVAHSTSPLWHYPRQRRRGSEKGAVDPRKGLDGPNRPRVPC